MLIKALNYTLTIILDNCVSTEAHFTLVYKLVSQYFVFIWHNCENVSWSKNKHKLNSEIMTQSDELTPPQFFRDSRKQFVLSLILMSLQSARYIWRKLNVCYVNFISKLGRLISFPCVYIQTRLIKSIIFDLDLRFLAASFRFFLDSCACFCCFVPFVSFSKDHVYKYVRY